MAGVIADRAAAGGPEVPCHSALGLAPDAPDYPKISTLVRKYFSCSVSAPPRARVTHPPRSLDADRCGRPTGHPKSANSTPKPCQNHLPPKTPTLVLRASGACLLSHWLSLCHLSACSDAPIVAAVRGCPASVMASVDVPRIASHTVICLRADSNIIRTPRHCPSRKRRAAAKTVPKALIEL